MTPEERIKKIEEEESRKKFNGIPAAKFFGPPIKSLTDREEKRYNGQAKLIGTHIPSEELLRSYVPKHAQPIVTFAGVGTLHPGHSMNIIGPTGFGKSNVSEAIVSSYLNPYVDNLGFKINIPDNRPLLWIDGERPRDDIAMGFDRIDRRIRIQENPDLIAGDRFKNVYCHPFIMNPLRDWRILELKRLIIEHQPGLVVLDGLANFVYDVNDTKECVDFLGQLMAWANQFDFGVIQSIHPNPGGSNDYKPRGVLGSEAIRDAESNLLLKRAPDDRDVRILTMDFMHGKNRNEADNLEHAFRWNNESKMFLSCDYTAVVVPRKAEQQNDLFALILKDGVNLTHGDLTKALIQAGKSESTAKRWIRESTAIEKNPINEKYFLR